MLQTITPQAMKSLENTYMQQHGLPGALLMEHAALALRDAIARRIPGGKVLFLCGPGNNGGDGYAAARLWAASGGQALVMELSSSAAGDAALNRRLALEAGVEVIPAALPLPPCQLIVDALFGTGLARPVEGMAAELIAAANASCVPILAVDIPSGLHGETGRALGPAIRAAETVTFHRIKQGLLLLDGPRHAGQISLGNIIIPAGYGDAEGLRILEAADLPGIIPPRPADAHKGSFGRVVIMAGSEGMAGAAGFCTGAAVKAGAGLTTVICPRDVLPIVQVLAPGATCVPLEEADIPQLLSRADAAAIGCGLGQDPSLLPALECFRRASCPVVWDADALNLLAAHDLLPLPGNAVITPHPGEAARLLHTNIADVTADPLAVLDALRQACGCHVLLKGCRPLMTDGAHRAVNILNAPALAKGGSGDVLTGILAALLPRKLPMLTAMQTAALVHSMAAQRAAAALGEHCVTPTDLIAAIRLG